MYFIRVHNVVCHGSLCRKLWLRLHEDTRWRPKKINQKTTESVVSAFKKNHSLAVFLQWLFICACLKWCVQFRKPSEKRLVAFSLSLSLSLPFSFTISLPLCKLGPSIFRSDDYENCIKSFLTLNPFWWHTHQHSMTGRFKLQSFYYTFVLLFKNIWLTFLKEVTDFYTMSTPIRETLYLNFT